VEVTEGLQHHVKQKLSAVLAKFNGASFIEGEGGIKDVDVKLMNSQVALVVRPQVQNKAMHDTYLRQGEMKVLEFGSDVYDSLDKAVASLEKKLHKYSKPLPQKKDYRKA
jgi:ribosome-associated translation inhibitor RaiA